MKTYIEKDGKIAFHPAYYIQELVDTSGLSQADFAKRLDTTPKNLSKLCNGKQNLSVDMATKLSRMLGTSIEYWLNLQNKYDQLLAEFASAEELGHEREIFKYLDYSYFVEHFGLPKLARKIDEQIEKVRELLRVSSLCVLKRPDFAVNFRSSKNELSLSNIMASNAMMQLAVNKVLELDAPPYNKQKFSAAADQALSLSSEHSTFLPEIQSSFSKAGVLLVALPHLKNSAVNGACKKVGNHILLMVSNRNQWADTFWFSLYHEVGHILNGHFGISCNKDKGEKEDIANQYARTKLIPEDEYQSFLEKDDLSADSIRAFANAIHRDPGIVAGRLYTDEIIPYSHTALSVALRHKYKVSL